MNRVIVMISKVMIVFYLFMPVPVQAGAMEDYEEAYKLYVAATACMAAYSDRVGGLAYDALEEENWKIQPYIQKTNQADARFLLAKKMQSESGLPLYLLAVVGTETVKDIKVDLRVGKVYFAGQTPEEFVMNAQLQDIPNSLPKAHQGFNQYVQAALATKGQDGVDELQQRLLTEMLLEDRTRKVYLVGHSLGGAVATLGAARLLDMGVQPEQIEIITFGAPAVGNKAFREKFEPILHLTRVVTSGDLIIKSLQKMVGGYEQFGREIHWAVPDNAIHNPHQMVTYLDLAIKDYYQKRSQVAQTGEIIISDQREPISGAQKIYVAPIKNCLPESLQGEMSYMKEALQDEYRFILPGYVLDQSEEDNDIFQKAQALGCQLVIVPEIEAYKMKNEENGYYITLNQVVYDVVTGEIVNVASYGSSTNSLTPLEAFIHDAKNMSHDNHGWLLR